MRTRVTGDQICWNVLSELADKLFTLRQGRAAFVERFVSCEVVPPEFLISQPRSPEIQSYVAAGDIAVANQLGTDIALSATKKSNPSTVRAVGLFKSGPLIAAGVKFPNRGETTTWRIDIFAPH